MSYTLIRMCIKVEPQQKLLDIVQELKHELSNEKFRWVDLNNMHITLKFFGDTNIDDISFLEGMKLEKLNLSNTKISDISALKDMPLLKLDLSGCSMLKDFKTLMSCKSLSELILPDHAEDIEFLREHRGIEKIKRTSDIREFSFTEDFWKEYYMNKEDE